MRSWLNLPTGDYGHGICMPPYNKIHVVHMLHQLFMYPKYFPIKFKRLIFYRVMNMVKDFNYIFTIPHKKNEWFTPSVIWDGKCILIKLQSKPDIIWSQIKVPFSSSKKPKNGGGIQCGFSATWWWEQTAQEHKADRHWSWYNITVWWLTDQMSSQWTNTNPISDSRGGEGYAAKNVDSCILSIFIIFMAFKKKWGVYFLLGGGGGGRSEKNVFCVHLWKCCHFWMTA